MSGNIGQCVHVSFEWSTYSLSRSECTSSPYRRGGKEDKQVKLHDYRTARKFSEVKFSRKLIPLSFCDFIFMDSGPIAIINDINIVSQIKIFAGRNKSAKTAKILLRGM